MPDCLSVNLSVCSFAHLSEHLSVDFLSCLPVCTVCLREFSLCQSVWSLCLLGRPYVSHMSFCLAGLVNLFMWIYLIRLSACSVFSVCLVVYPIGFVDLPV